MMCSHIDNGMKALSEWIKAYGTEGRRKLFHAIKAEYPTFTQTSLTNYLKGQRIPEMDVALIISRETGIPLDRLSWRYVHLAKTPQTNSNSCLVRSQLPES